MLHCYNDQRVGMFVYIMHRKQLKPTQHTTFNLYIYIYYTRSQILFDHQLLFEQVLYIIILYLCISYKELA